MNSEKDRIEKRYELKTLIPAYLRGIETRRSESLINMQGVWPRGFDTEPQGGWPESAGNRWRETSSPFFKNRGFQLRGGRFFERVEHRGHPMLSDRAESFISYYNLELKL